MPEITAPFDGVVTARHVHTGHFLQPSNSGTTSKSAEPLFMMMRTDIMRCTVEVPELDAGLIKKGDMARVRFQAKTGEVPELEAKVTRDSFPSTNMPARYRRDFPEESRRPKLMPGMYANVTILAKLRNALTLPADAILSDILADGDRNYCFMLENGKVIKTFLEVGAHCDEGVQVLRKQRPGGKWEKITGKEAVVVEPKKKARRRALPARRPQSPSRRPASGGEILRDTLTSGKVARRSAADLPPRSGGLPYSRPRLFLNPRFSHSYCTSPIPLKRSKSSVRSNRYCQARMVVAQDSFYRGVEKKVPHGRERPLERFRVTDSFAVPC